MNKKYWQLQKEAALSNSQAANWLDVGLTTIKRWRKGDNVPKAVLMALEYRIKYGEL